MTTAKHLAVKAAPALAPKPQLPEFLARAVDPADERSSALILPWRLPSAAFCARHRAAIENALAELQRHCVAAPEGLVRELLARCAEVKAARDGTAAEWTVRTAEYLRLLGHYPADIWQNAVDAHMLNCRFFPDISELEARMAPLLRQRHIAIQRLEFMLAPRKEQRPMTKDERARISGRMQRLGQVLRVEALGDLQAARRFIDTGQGPRPEGTAPAAKPPASKASAGGHAALQVYCEAKRKAFMGEAT